MDIRRSAFATQDFPLSGDFLAGRLRKHLNHGDLTYIEGLFDQPRILPARETLVHQGNRMDVSAMLVSGFMFRTINRGTNRHIVGIHLPGDFVDLHSFALKRLDHSIVAVDDVSVAMVEHAKLERVMRERPHIARAMWFATLLDASIHRKWVQIMESLDAPRRIAHIFCELQSRLKLIGRASDKVVRTPFTQKDIADMSGVSAIHANRALSKLRELELAEIRRGTLYTEDWDALRKYAGFDASYLYGDGPLQLNEGWE
ncbi:Crp/Fnr family transcriptional regulator [Erythrobacter sp. SCSIO 43205]|uniref:Crp/Fnr family transcriptional regulator n=1 Tax=Erythrobacter sp. SCSIO 43205 TaxID=2779361 RepID=UPI001CAA1025|nr:Crp/Fnr family transcriptional regulator [Erythrobacter sp. SCSIO 43205]UAB78400.1 Crp/Fnr family transcriptional regulator [Erythrobacter sp. SCSIO 43205]